MTDKFTGDTERSLRGLGYSSNGQMHVIPDDPKTWFDERVREKQAALCGAPFPQGNLHDVNGLRMSDEVVKGRFCDTCLGQLREVGASIPGFIDSGALVGEASRCADSESNRDEEGGQQ